MGKQVHHTQAHPIRHLTELEVFRVLKCLIFPCNTSCLQRLLGDVRSWLTGSSNYQPGPNNPQGKVLSFEAVPSWRRTHPGIYIPFTTSDLYNHISHSKGEVDPEGFLNLIRESFQIHDPTWPPQCTPNRKEKAMVFLKVPEEETKRE